MVASPLESNNGVHFVILFCPGMFRREDDRSPATDKRRPLPARAHSETAVSSLLLRIHRQIYNTRHGGSLRTLSNTKLLEAFTSVA